MSFFFKCFQSNTTGLAPVSVAVNKIGNTIKNANTNSNNNEKNLPPTIQEFEKKINEDAFKLNNISLKEYNCMIESRAEELSQVKIDLFLKKHNDSQNKLIQEKASEIAKQSLCQHVKYLNNKHESDVLSKANELASQSISAKIQEINKTFHTLIPTTSTLKYSTRENSVFNNLVSNITYKIMSANYNGKKYILLNKETEFGPEQTRKNYQECILKKLKNAGYNISEQTDVFIHEETKIITNYWKISWEKLT